MPPHDPRDLPNYTLAEAARWLAIKPNRLRVWLLGQKHHTKPGAWKSAPVVEPAQSAPLVLSFWNLVECSVLSSMNVQHKVPLQQVRRALGYVAKERAIQRPLIDASGQGQIAIREVLAAELSRIPWNRIERDADGLAARLFPWRRSPEEPKIVAVDPKIAFGQPVLVHTSVPLQVLFDRFRAGDTLAHLAAEYLVKPRILEQAVRAWYGPAAV